MRIWNENCVRVSTTTWKPLTLMHFIWGVLYDMILLRLRFLLLSLYLFAWPLAFFSCQLGYSGSLKGRWNVHVSRM